MISTDTFESAADNMAFDAQLLENISPNNAHFRCYQWQAPAITYSRLQTCPDDLANFSSAKRVTGGGIAFHSPGDFSFSYVAHQNDSRLGTRLKDRLTSLAHILETALAACQVHTHPPSGSADAINHAFCHTYPTPYERQINHDKIIAMSLRNHKDRFIIQGLIHLYSNFPHFGHLAQYRRYLSNGIWATSTDTPAGFYEAFVKHLKQLVELENIADKMRQCS